MSQILQTNVLAVPSQELIQVTMTKELTFISQVLYKYVDRIMIIDSERKFSPYYFDVNNRAKHSDHFPTMLPLRIYASRN